MNAMNAIKNMLKEVYEDGDVNAMEIFKGFAVNTGQSGWHFRQFGRLELTYLGKSVVEARETINEIKEYGQVIINE